jgi:hypothetical protein
VSGTSIDPVNDTGAAFSYSNTKVSFFSLSLAKEVALYDTGTINSTSYSGASGVFINGIVMDGAKKEAIIATGDGLQVVDYSTPSAPKLVRTIKSKAANSTGGIGITENFGYDPSISIGGKAYSLALTGVYSSTTVNVLELVDVDTGKIYIPDAATNALFTVSQTIDAMAVDTTYHVAILADEGTGTIFVNLNKLTLGATADANGYYSFTLPSTAVSRISNFSKYDNLGIESTNHLVFMGQGFGGASFVVGKLSDPAASLGFSSYLTTPYLMPTQNDDKGTSVTWTGALDPHGAGAYITASDHPTLPSTSLAMWVHNDGIHVAIINLKNLLANGATAGYNPTKTNPKDIGYFLVP